MNFEDYVVEASGGEETAHKKEMAHKINVLFQSKPEEKLYMCVPPRAWNIPPTEIELPGIVVKRPIFSGELEAIIKDQRLREKQMRDMAEQLKPQEPFADKMEFDNWADRVFKELLEIGFEIPEAIRFIEGQRPHKLEGYSSRYIITEEMANQKCRICGCDWFHPCEGGCYWMEKDLCSQCYARLKSTWWGRLRLWWHRFENSLMER